MNERALVTGASRGIGQATAIRLARDFGRVVVVPRGEDGLAETAEAVEAHGAQAFRITADLRDPKAEQMVLDRTLDRFGVLDALVNIAGALPQVDLFAASSSNASRLPPFRRWRAARLSPSKELLGEIP